MTTTSKEPQLKDFYDPITGDDGWGQYQKAKSDWIESQKTFSWNYRLKLQELIDNRDWNKAIKYAEPLQFSDPDSKHFNSIIQKMIISEGGWNSKFAILYGRPLMSAVLGTGNKNSQLLEAQNKVIAQEVQSQTQAKNGKQTILIILANLTGFIILHTVILEYQIDKLWLWLLAIVAWVLYVYVYMYLPSVKNS